MLFDAKTAKLVSTYSTILILAIDFSFESCWNFIVPLALNCVYNGASFSNRSISGLLLPNFNFRWTLDGVNQKPRNPSKAVSYSHCENWTVNNVLKLVINAPNPCPADLLRFQPPGEVPVSLFLLLFSARFLYVLYIVNNFFFTSQTKWLITKLN